MLKKSLLAVGLALSLNTNANLLTFKNGVRTAGAATGVLATYLAYQLATKTTGQAETDFTKFGMITALGVGTAALFCYAQKL